MLKQNHPFALLMTDKSDIYIYDIYSIDSIPVKKILRILQPILINYKIRDKKFMWVNLRKPIPDTLWMEITDLQEDLFCQRFSLYMAHILLTPPTAEPNQ